MIIFHFELVLVTVRHLAHNDRHARKRGYKGPDPELSFTTR